MSLSMVFSIFSFTFYFKTSLRYMGFATHRTRATEQDMDGVVLSTFTTYEILLGVFAFALVTEKVEEVGYNND